VLQLLGTRGYRLEGFEYVLGMPLDGARASGAGGIDVGLTGDLAGWGAVAVEGFMHPDETSGHAETFPRAVMEQVFADLARAAGFRRYLARIDGQVAGAASLFVHGNIAFLSGATTLPPFRRRGAQTALLARRLDDAARLGCALACVVTAPGTRSQANAQRGGFSLLYARAVLMAPAARPGSS
jgi:hypothetical protein